MIHAKSLTVIGLFGIFATATSSAAAAPIAAGQAAVQRAAANHVILVQDRTQRPRRAKTNRNVGQANALLAGPGPAIPSGPIDLYQQGDPCRYIYPCSMSNTLD